jgi:hypothetical protein
MASAWRLQNDFSFLRKRTSEAEEKEDEERCPEKKKLRLRFQAFSCPIPEFNRRAEELYRPRTREEEENTTLFSLLPQDIKCELAPFLGFATLYMAGHVRDLESTLCWAVKEYDTYREQKIGAYRTRWNVIRRECLREAAAHGHLSILQWAARPEQSWALDNDIAIQAAQRGHRHVLEWLHGVCKLRFDWEVLLAAANVKDPTQRSDLVHWLHETCGVPLCVSTIIDAFAKHGDLADVQWALQKGCPINEYSALQWAVESGDPPTMRWFVERGTPVGKYMFCNIAALYDTETFRWACTKSDGWRTHEAAMFRCAAEGDRVETLQYIVSEWREHLRPSWWQSALAAAITNNALKATRWLFDNLDPDAELDVEDLRRLAQDQDEAILREIDRIFGENKAV